MFVYAIVHSANPPPPHYAHQNTLWAVILKRNLK